ncbi:unnamed protein product [Thlaspi arvense]|uniref:Uncharacterized protein n=1 Tax=Thlaspi arvense TaxID=13288 RepID=A0AAU9S790_THLAR|nr:unnamed protein product [Thlaspi arvense]
MFQSNMVPVDTNNNGDGNNENNNDNDNNDNNNMNVGRALGGEDVNNANNTSENQGDGSGRGPRPNKRKRYHRHTQHQIQEMEAFFKECPHPDDKQRKDLGRQLGLDHLQIKFWFQNKRTQNKNHQERHENTHLRGENSTLRADNHRMREAVASALCPKCGGHTAVGEMSFEEHHLRLENDILIDEIRQMSAVAAKYTGKKVMSYPQIPAQPFDQGTGGHVYASMVNFPMKVTGVTDADKPKIIELAVGAMEELMAMAQIGEPLWKGGVNGTTLAMNLDEYSRIFRNGLGPRPNGFRTEASRETAVVFMSPMNVVERLMDVSLWSSMFAGLIARAMTHEVILNGINGNFDGAFHLMTAEYLVLSPIVSTRECYFVRYCKKQGEGLWAVVDISVDQLVPNLQLKCRRRPSGCLIQETPNGCSQVTWVEHVEVDDRGGVSHFYKYLVSTGQALGANRWIATLDRQCERVASSMVSSIPSIEPDDLLIMTNQSKRSMLKIAERMWRSFFSGLAGSSADMWTCLSGYVGESMRVMTRNSVNDPGRPPGVILCAATSFWVPAPANVIFDFLREENNRIHWDVLSIGGHVQKLTEITNGRDSRNCVSLLQAPSTGQSKMTMIQESSVDPTTSFLIYAPVDVKAIEIVLNGGDPDYVALLPSGFGIIPNSLPGPAKEDGSLLNIAFQILVEASPSATLTVSSVATIENLLGLSKAHTFSSNGSVFLLKVLSVG